MEVLDEEGALEVVNFTATVGTAHSNGRAQHGNKCHSNIWPAVLAPAAGGG